MTDLRQDGMPESRVVRRQQQTRTKLIDAIRKLTAEKGVEAVTIRDIAAEADIAMGSFYNYFESKELLLNEALEEIMFQAGDAIDLLNQESDDPLEVIATAFATFSELSKHDPLLGWFVVRMTSYDRSIGATLAERFERDLKKGLASGQFDVPDLRIAMSAAQTALIDFLHQQLSGAVSENGLIDFIHLMLRMLGADEAASRRTAERAVTAARQRAEEED